MPIKIEEIIMLKNKVNSDPEARYARHKKMEITGPTLIICKSCSIEC
jgi:hypothetical protein